MKMNKME